MPLPISTPTCRGVSVPLTCSSGGRLKILSVHLRYIYKRKGEITEGRERIQALVLLGRSEQSCAVLGGWARSHYLSPFQVSDYQRELSVSPYYPRSENLCEGVLGQSHFPDGKMEAYGNTVLCPSSLGDRTCLCLRCGLGVLSNILSCWL